MVMYNWEEIDRYLLGRLSMHRLKDLEFRIREDPALGERIRERRLYIMALEKHSVEHLKECFLEIESELDKEDFFLSDEYIDSYLLGNVSADVRQQIDLQREEDPYLEKLLAFRGSGISQLEGAFSEELKETISGIEKGLLSEGFFEKADQENRFSAKVIQFTSHNRLSIAIAVSVVIALGIFFIFRPNGTYPDLFDTYYSWQKPYLDENIEDSKALGLVTENAEMLQARGPFLSALSLGDYSEANSLISSHLKDWPDDPIAQYYHGISLIELKQFRRAATALEMIDPQFVYKSDADWYLALCYLRIKGKCEQAKELLSRISTDPSSPYHDQSNQMMAMIKC